ncbi:hypothetical protein Tco_1420354 [Tanacetum coccineum]
MGHGSAHGSAPVDDDEEDDSPVNEEPPKDWTVEEEIALCQTWCDVSGNSEKGNSMKAKGFWEAVIKYFEKESGSTRCYDSILSKWKNRIRPRIGVFAPSSIILKRIMKVVQMTSIILKDRQGWLDVKMPSFYNNTKGRKKSKTSETTSGSASDGFNLNNEADESEEETQEQRPMGRDRSMAKKKSPASSRGGSSSFVDLVADKLLNVKKEKWGRSNKSPIYS